MIIMSMFFPEGVFDYLKHRYVPPQYLLSVPFYFISIDFYISQIHKCACDGALNNCHKLTNDLFVKDELRLA